MQGARGPRLSCERKKTGRDIEKPGADVSGLLEAFPASSPAPRLFKMSVHYNVALQPVNLVELVCGGRRERWQKRALLLPFWEKNGLVQTDQWGSGMEALKVAMLPSQPLWMCLKHPSPTQQM